MPSSLVEQLRDEHRQTVLSLSELRRSLLAEDREAALRAADALDLLTGPHIRFEEQSLYPALREVDPSRVKELHLEHGAIARTLSSIRQRLADGATAVPFHVIAAELAPFFHHTLSCDGALYMVERFTDEVKAALQAALDRERAGRGRLTEAALS